MKVFLLFFLLKWCLYWELFTECILISYLLCCHNPLHWITTGQATLYILRISLLWLQLLSSGHVQLRDLYLHFTKMKTILWSCLSNVQCSSASPVIHFPNTVLWGRGGRGSDKLGLNVPWNNWEDTFFSQPMWNHWLLSLKLKINYVSGYLYIDKVVSEAVNKKGVKILNLLMIRNVQKWKTLDFK